MYKCIEESDVFKIREIILEAELCKSINIELGKFKLTVDKAEDIHNTTHWENSSKDEFYLLTKDDERGVLEYKGKKYDVFINVGNWPRYAKYIFAHIALGSSKFDKQCFQIELSQAVKKDGYIYIIKNITNMAREGAICRLYNGLGSNRSEKINRQNKFIEELNGKQNKEIIKHKNKDWIVISKISCKELNDKNNYDKLLYNLLYDLLYAMLVVEDIILN